MHHRQNLLLVVPLAHDLQSHGHIPYILRTICDMHQQLRSNRANVSGRTAASHKFIHSIHRMTLRQAVMDLIASHMNGERCRREVQHVCDSRVPIVMELALTHSGRRGNRLYHTIDRST